MIVPSAGTPVVNAITATGSGVVGTNNLENITFQFSATGISGGNGVLTVLGSNDGVTFTAISFVDPTQANTNAQTLIRITSITLSSNTSAVGVIENLFKFAYIKFTVTVTTNGAYSVWVNADTKAKS